MAASPIDVYRREIEKELQAGNPTERPHRLALETLINSLPARVTATKHVGSQFRCYINRGPFK